MDLTYTVLLNDIVEHDQEAAIAFRTGQKISCKPIQWGMTYSHGNFTKHLKRTPER